MQVNFHDRKVLAASFLAIFIVGLVAGTALIHQNYAMQAREGFAYNNPVTIDLWKQAPDNSILQSGWVYLGHTAQGYHYQYQTHNMIITAGQNWEVSRLTGGTAAGQAVYIALGTTNSPARTDASIAGGEFTVGGLQRAQAQATNIGAAAGGTITWTLVNTFTATSAANTVQIAGLFTTTGTNAATLWAETTFAAVNLSSGDTLTITWQIVSNGS